MAQPIAASSIAQQAFRFLEMAPISSFADDSEEARAAAEQYPHALRMCLEWERADWSFARRLVTLPVATLPEGAAADPDLPYVYAVPGDCVAVQEVIPGDIAWREDGEYLRADEATSLQLIYTYVPAKEDTLPSLFQTAVALQLAVLLGPGFATTRNKVADLNAALEAAVRRAVSADARSASGRRYDGRARTSDWASEAMS